jgi:putative FmdB family regulatory protein
LPIYEYRCKNGHNFEVTQSMADDPVAVCQVCGAPVERVFHPVAVHFKGSGFYTTDYGRKRGGGASSDSDSGSGSKDDSKSDSTKTDSSKSDSKDKASAKSESSSSSSADD